MDYLLVRDGHANTGPWEKITEEEMEWILNALRGVQEEQQELASKHDGTTITRADVIESIGGTPLPGDEEVSSDDMGDLFRSQHSDVTNLREKLVKFVGRDLTDS